MTQPGLTTVSLGTIGDPSSPPAPSNYAVGNPPIYYASNTSAIFSGSVIVCLDYSAVTYSHPDLLKLLHYDVSTGAWQDITTSLDLANNRICGTTASLSPFLAAEFRYQFAGFFPPVGNPPIVNLAKAGSAVPVKFNLGANLGLGVLATGSPTVGVDTCGIAPLDEIDQTVAATSSGLQYDLTANQYVYVWKTDATWKNTCRRLTLTFRDGQVRSGLFQFK